MYNARIDDLGAEIWQKRKCDGHAMKILDRQHLQKYIWRYQISWDDNGSYIHYIYSSHVPT